MEENKDTREGLNEELYDEVVEDAAAADAEKQFEVAAKENNKNKKNKKKISIILGIVLGLIVVSIVLILVFSPKKEEEKPKDSVDYAKVYESAITEYGIAAYNESLRYMLSNSGRAPEWKDIESKIDYKKYEVSCDISLINKDGTVYLEKCKVKDIDYSKATFTYGKKLEEEVLAKNATKLYVVKYKDYANDYEFMVTDYDNTKHNLIKEYSCKTTGCIPYGGGNKRFTIYDGAHYIYDYSKGTTTLINIGLEKYNDVTLVTYDNKDYGVIVSKDNRTVNETAYYSFAKEQYIVEFTKNIYIYTHKDVITQGYIFKTNYDKGVTEVININTGSNKYTFNETYVDIINNGEYIYYQIYDNDTWSIYNNNFKKILSLSDYDRMAVNSTGNITVNWHYNHGEGPVEIYDPNGKKIKSSKNYSNVLHVLNDYIMVVDTDNYIKLIDSNFKEVATFEEWKESFNFYEYSSGLSKYNGNDCIIIVVGDTEIEEGQDGYAKGYYYDLVKKKTGIIQARDVSDF